MAEDSDESLNTSARDYTRLTFLNNERDDDDDGDTQDISHDPTDSHKKKRRRRQNEESRKPSNVPNNSISSSQSQKGRIATDAALGLGAIGLGALGAKAWGWFGKDIEEKGEDIGHGLRIIARDASGAIGRAVERSTGIINSVRDHFSKSVAKPAEHVSHAAPSVGKEIQNGVEETFQHPASEGKSIASSIAEDVKNDAKPELSRSTRSSTLSSALGGTEGPVTAETAPTFRTDIGKRPRVLPEGAPHQESQAAHVSKDISRRGIFKQERSVEKTTAISEGRKLSLADALGSKIGSIEKSAGKDGQELVEIGKSIGTSIASGSRRISAVGTTIVKDAHQIGSVATSIGSTMIKDSHEIGSVSRVVGNSVERHFVARQASKIPGLGAASGVYGVSQDLHDADMARRVAEDPKNSPELRKFAQQIQERSLRNAGADGASTAAGQFPGVGSAVAEGIDVVNTGVNVVADVRDSNNPLRQQLNDAEKELPARPISEGPTHDLSAGIPQHRGEQVSRATAQPRRPVAPRPPSSSQQIETSNPNSQDTPGGEPAPTAAPTPPTSTQPTVPAPTPESSTANQQSTPPVAGGGTSSPSPAPATSADPAKQAKVNRPVAPPPPQQSQDYAAAAAANLIDRMESFTPTTGPSVTPKTGVQVS